VPYFSCLFGSKSAMMMMTRRLYAGLKELGPSCFVSITRFIYQWAFLYYSSILALYHLFHPSHQNVSSFSKGFSHLGQTLGYQDLHGTIMPLATPTGECLRVQFSPFHSQKVIQLKIWSLFSLIALNASF
jgi:hypothetical protein